MTNAVRLMYAGAALSVLNGVIGALTAHSLVISFITQFDNQLPPGQAGTVLPTGLLTNMLAVGLVFAGLLDASLWLWMAWKNNTGRSWARVLSTVFFGLLCLSTLSAVLRVSADGPGRLILSLVTFAVALLAVISIWRPESSLYYQSVRSQAASRRGQAWAPGGGYAPGYRGHGPGAWYGPPQSAYGYGSPQSTHGYAPPAPPASPPEPADTVDLPEHRDAADPPESAG